MYVWLLCIPIYLQERVDETTNEDNRFIRANLSTCVKKRNLQMNENQLMLSNDHKRYRSITKSFEDNTKIPTSPTNRIKRKTLLTNSEGMSEYETYSYINVKCECVI